VSAQSLRAHNTVAENGSGDGVGIGVGSGSAVGLVNTIVASQTVGISHTGGSTVLAQYTLFDANGLNYAGSVTSTNEISGPAGLMPANYHLRSGSGAIDRAYPLAADHRRGRRPAAARCGTRRGGGRGPVRPPAAGVAGLVNQSKGEHKMRTKHLIICLALGLGLAPLLFLLATLHTSHASSPVEQVRYVATTGRDSIPLGGGFFTPNNCLDSADPCRTVQRATDAAAPDDQIRVAAGIYTGVRARDGMTQVLHIAKSVTIRGGYTTTNWGASFPLTQPTTLDAQGLGRVVAITGSVAPTLDGLVIAHGNAAGQAADCPTIHGTPSGCGGGIFIYAASPLIVNSTITDNVASAAAGATGTGYGGGLYLKNAHGAVISGNVIISNVASLTGFGDGGGLYLDHSDAQVCANQVLDNYATKINTSGWGGGISAFSGAPTIENNVLRGNWVNPSGTNYPGAAIYLWNDSGTYSGNQITENHGQSAIFLSRGQPRLESNQVISNATAIGVELFSGPGAATRHAGNPRGGAERAGADSHVDPQLAGRLWRRQRHLRGRLHNGVRDQHDRRQRYLGHHQRLSGQRYGERRSQSVLGQHLPRHPGHQSSQRQPALCGPGRRRLSHWPRLGGAGRRRDDGDHDRRGRRPAPHRPAARHRRGRGVAVGVPAAGAAGLLTSPYPLHPPARRIEKPKQPRHERRRRDGTMIETNQRVRKTGRQR
jgi:hypothetical protein